MFTGGGPTTFRNGTLNRRRSPIWPAPTFPKFLLIVMVRFLRCGALTVDDLIAKYLLEVGARWWAKSHVICSPGIMAFPNGDLRLGRLLLMLVHNCSCNLSHRRPSNSFWLSRYGAAFNGVLLYAPYFDDRELASTTQRSKNFTVAMRSKYVVGAIRGGWSRIFGLFLLISMFSMWISSSSSSDRHR